MQLCFVGGIHGSGKSSLCAQLAPPLGAEHIIASQLIMHATSSSDPADKTVANVQTNQERLLAGLRRLRPNSSRVLLDGHFCLLTRTMTVERIAVDVFADMKPACLLVVEADTAEILKRLESRDNREYDRDVILELAQSEREHANHVSKTLGIPVMVAGQNQKTSDVLAYLRAEMNNPRGL